MNDRIRTNIRHTGHDHTPVFQAVKVDSKSHQAFYSKEKEGQDVESFVKHNSVKTVDLNKDETRRLKRLLKITNWALIRVLDENSEAEWCTEKYTHRQYFTVKGKYERWYCHRLGPEGQGRQFDYEWREIEFILEEAILRNN